MDSKREGYRIDIERLYAIAKEHNIPVVDMQLKYISAMAVCIGEKCAIGIDYKQISSTADEKVKLAHELGHCITKSFYSSKATADFIHNQENTADLWAIKTIIPKSNIDTALKNGIENVEQLADCFDVTKDYIEKALHFYYQ